MKKLQLFLVMVAAVALQAQAKTLRVNSVSGMATYTSIQAAVDAASDGDVIMVDASPDVYEKTTINKRITLIGPGYFLRNNNMEIEVTKDARVDGLIIKKEGVAVMGMHIFDGDLDIQAPKVVITRCRVSGWSEVRFLEGADNCILHQNYMPDNQLGGGIFWGNPTYNHQITNNILKMQICNINNSYIAYNTCFEGTSTPNPYFSANNKLEHNIVSARDFGQDDKSNTYTDNHFMEIFDVETDMQVWYKTGSYTSYGAFGGNDPYILSGIPAGPVIEQLTVPASVEQGGKLNVTIKLGRQK